MFTFSMEELQALLRQLDLVINDHEQWSKGLEKTLICRSDFDPHDVTPQAHRQCQFGEWYYTDAPEKLRQLPSFIAIEAEHENMHQVATSLLMASAAGNTVSPHEYDDFALSLERFRVHVRSLKRELTEQLYERDPLTGVNSRVGLLSYLREQRELVRRGLQICSLVMMDLDDFKSVNDRHGHLFGDQVLAGTTSFLMKRLRAYDKVFRYGGDEFLISLPGLTAENSRLVVERLCSELPQMPFSVPDGSIIAVTASFGIAEITFDHPVEAILGQADKALYAAKEAGRNCVRTWDPAL